MILLLLQQRLIILLCFFFFGRACGARRETDRLPSDTSGKHAGTRPNDDVLIPKRGTIITADVKSSS